MSDALNQPAITPLRAILVALALMLAIVVYALAWLGIADWFDGFHGWMALLAAPVVAAPLRLLEVSAGTPRCILATMATAAAIAFASWLVVAAPIAGSMGLTPLSAALRIGPHFAWTLLTLAYTPLNWGWIAISLVLAARFGYRDDDGFSGRRPGP